MQAVCDNKGRKPRVSPVAKQSLNGIVKKRNKEVMIRLWGGKILEKNIEENIGEGKDKVSRVMRLNS